MTHGRRVWVWVWGWVWVWVREWEDAGRKGKKKKVIASRRPFRAGLTWTSGSATTALTETDMALRRSNTVHGVKLWTQGWVGSKRACSVVYEENVLSD